MAQWGNVDQAADAPIWAAAQVKKTANTANRTAMFANTTANAFVTGAKVGVMGVGVSEMNTGRKVTAVTVTAPGTGWTARPTIGFTGGGGTGATATAVGKAITIAINTAGTGYTNADVVTVATGTGTAATATVTTNGAGVPASLALTTAGAYTVLPTLSGAATTGGTGADLTVDLTIGVGDVTVTNGGLDYTSAPTVTFGGAGGTGAAATAAVAANESKGVAHPGWVLRKEGTGGRAGRIHYETLVASGSMTGDAAADDTQLPE